MLSHELAFVDTMHPKHPSSVRFALDGQLHFKTHIIPARYTMLLSQRALLQAKTLRKSKSSNGKNVMKMPLLSVDAQSDLPVNSEVSLCCAEGRKSCY